VWAKFYQLTHKRPQAPQETNRQQTEWVARVGKKLANKLAEEVEQSDIQK